MYSQLGRRWLYGCRLLELPAPYIDALNRPAWDSSATDVSKAYRKLSALVHPDKNPDADARLAFEALNKAHRALRDPGTLVSLIDRSKPGSASVGDSLSPFIALAPADSTEVIRQMS